jgi:hypothetical protein
MEARTQEDRATSLFKQIEPELRNLLKDAPNWGACDLDFIMHDGNITRVITRQEKQ